MVLFPYKGCRGEQVNAVEGCIEPIRQALREKYEIYNNDSSDEDFA